MVICFDIDGVLCEQVEGDYAQARPNLDMIAVLNRYYDRGCRIVLHTSRFMGRAGGDVIEAYRLGYEFTQQQLASWGVRYHELHMGKPRYDIVIDDRSIFYDADCNKLDRSLEERLDRKSVGVS